MCISPGVAWMLLNFTSNPIGYANSVNHMIIHPSVRPSIGTILCAECWCCQSSVLGYWEQSWTGRHSDTGYQQADTHFCRPRKDDRLRQPHLVLIQQPSGIWTQDPSSIPRPPLSPFSQHQAYHVISAAHNKTVVSRSNWKQFWIIVENGHLGWQKCSIHV